jgi:hypothetical protein
MQLKLGYQDTLEKLGINPGVLLNISGISND